MALTIKHNFVSPIIDQADPTLLGPDEWNDTHALSMATNKLLGRATAATGAIEEITLGTNLSFTGTTLDAAGGAPSAPSGSVQYNNASAFGGDASFTYAGNGAVTIGSAGHTGSVAFNGTTGGTVTVKPQDTAGTWTFKWPATAGTNTWVLTTDGSGVTSWTAPGSTANIVVGTSTVTSGTDTHVPYNNAGVYGEAANFTISSGNPNVIAGNSYMYDGMSIIRAQIAFNNFYEGGAGNLTGTGGNNFATGNGALASLTSGVGNVCIGVNAGALIANGGANVCMGTDAGSGITSASQNMIIGAESYVSANGGGNVVVGEGSMDITASTPNNNVAIGHLILRNVTGDNNVGICDSSLKAVTSGAGNLGVGASAGTAITDGTYNLCFGNSAGSALVHGIGNILFGLNALSSTDASYTVAMGYGVAQNTSMGDANVIIGKLSGAALTGAGNVILGPSEGTITSGSNNISIGGTVGVATATASNQLVIGNYIYGTGLSGTGSTISSGKIGIGIKAPANELDVAGAISLSTFIEGTEISAPAAPAANGFRIFAQDNGAGKTQLMVIFNTGAAQQIAIQP